MEKKRKGRKAKPWSGQLSSNFRGLDSKTSPLEFRNLTFIIGPNNAGKSQFLRSCVILDAVRQAVSDAFRRRPRHAGLIGGSAGSVAQALTNLGFRDLAEELGDLMARGGRISLAWQVTQSDFDSIATLAKFFQSRYFGPVDSGQSLETKSMTPRFTVTLAFERTSHELVVERLEVDGLWEGLGLTIANRRPGQTTLPPIRSPPDGHDEERGLSEYVLSWRINDKPIELKALRKMFGFVAQGQRYRRTWFAENLPEILMSRALGFLPSLIYIGPIRIVDDRDYAVATERASQTVGRTGEFTWVRLRELEKLPAESKQWFADHASRVLNLTGFATARESTTKPKVTARIGKLTLPLHNYGLGTSQALPILVQLATTLPGTPSDTLMAESRVSPTIIVIEEPESHLHPAAQKALGFAIADYAARGGHILLETHSEIILRAVGLRIAEGTLAPHQAGVNWVDFRPPELRSGEKCMFLPFQKDGSLETTLPVTFDQVVSELIEDRLMARRE